MLMDLWASSRVLNATLYITSRLLAILVTGLNNSTWFALHFCAIAAYLNSSLNPILYCWKIKELKDKVTAGLRALWNILTG